MIDERVGKRSRFNSRTRMNHHSSGLIHDNQIVVFINNAERDWLGNKLDGRRLEQVYLDVISLAQAIARFGHALVHQNFAVFDGALDSSAAYVLENGGKE